MRLATPQREMLAQLIGGQYAAIMVTCEPLSPDLVPIMRERVLSLIKAMERGEEVLCPWPRPRAG